MTRIEQTDGAPSTGDPISEKRVDLSYNGAGQFDAIARYADLAGTDLVATSSYSYDGIGRLTGLSHSKGANTLADYAWTFDAANRITSVTSNDGTTTFSYDATSQLTAADHSYQTDEAYEYDENGNRTSTGYQTGTNNLTLSDGTYSYQYDAEGNRIRKTTIATGEYVEYEWDHRNRLTALIFKTSGGVTTKEVRYRYDVFNRRIAKDVDDDGDGTFDRGERFVYDGWDLVLVYDESGSLENRYLYGPAIDQLFADEDALGEVLWGLTDHQGTVRDLVEYDATTDTTSAVNHIQYGSFGQIAGQTNSAAEPRISYTAQEWDADAWMYYYNARWYDPVLHQFASEDPIGFLAGDANLRRYVGNSSINFVDPSGEAFADPSLLPDGYAGYDPLPRPSWYPSWLPWGYRETFDPADYVTPAGPVVGISRRPVSSLLGRIGRFFRRAPAAVPDPPIATADDALRTFVQSTADDACDVVVPRISDGIRIGPSAPNGATQILVGVSDAGGLGAFDYLQYAEPLGPGIGRSGYATAADFSDEVFSRYQRYIDEGYDAVLRAASAGRLTPPAGVPLETYIGQRVDLQARIRLRNWIRGQGLSEGPGQIIEVNRWLRDPTGTGGYRIPDVRIPGGQLIFEGTIGVKTSSTPQIVDFSRFSGGDRITIVRPSQLGGSCSIR